MIHSSRENDKKCKNPWTRGDRETRLGQERVRRRKIKIEKQANPLKKCL